MPAQVVPLPESRIADAASVLTKAFLDYPLWTWLVPDEERRADLLPEYSEMNVRWGLLIGATYVTSPVLSGIAIWVPPDTSQWVDPDGSRTGWAAWGQRAGGEVTERMRAMGEVQQEARDRACAGSHWYLAWLGVDPEAQRRGAGSALLQHVFAGADASGMPCLLETEHADNVGYYERHGFEVTQHGVLPMDGPPYWTMRRDPIRALAR